MRENKANKRRRFLLRLAVGAFLASTVFSSLLSAEELQGYTPPPMFGTAPTPSPAPAPAPQPSPVPVQKTAPLMKPITSGDPMTRGGQRKAAPQSSGQTLQVPIREPKKPQIVSTRADTVKAPRPAQKPPVPVQAVIQTPVVPTVTEAAEDVVMQPTLPEIPAAPKAPKASQDVRIPDDDFMMGTPQKTQVRQARSYDPTRPVILPPVEDVTCAYNEETQSLLLPPDPVVGEDMSSGRRTYGTPKPAFKPLKDALFLKKYIEANTPPPVTIRGEQVKKAGYADVEAVPLASTPADLKQYEALSCPLIPEEAASTRVTFPAGETITVEGSEAVMQSVVDTLQQNGGAKLYIRAYASKAEGQEEIDARRLSLARGLAVRAWIMKQGIFPSRIEIKAMGSMSGEPNADFVDLVIGE